MRITARSLWQIRLVRELPRYLLYALALSGLLASARFAIDPPRSVNPPAGSLAHSSRDLPAEGFASLFARRYMTWTAQHPEGHAAGLSPFVRPGADTDAGLRVPLDGEQHVEWVEVVQERQPRVGEHVYTLAVQTDTARLLYLSVSVVRDQAGQLSLADYPAFVGAPASSAVALGSSGSLAGGAARDVEDAGLASVVARALRNYLAASISELAADLTSSARVSLPGLRLALRTVRSLRWLPGGGSVDATVLAEDRRGVQYTLDYELDVTRQGGRWEVSAIQMDPDK